MGYDTDDGREFLTHELKGTSADDGNAYSSKWDYLCVDAYNSTNLDMGLSLAFAYHSLMAWRIFFDDDFTRKHYYIAYYPTEFRNKAAHRLTVEGRPVNAVDYIHPHTTVMKKEMLSFTLGGAFSISF